MKCFSPLRGTQILFCRHSWKYFSPLRGTKILFCRRGLIFFLPLRGTNSETIHYLLSHFFKLKYTLKNMAKAPSVDLLRLNTLRVTKTAFLTSKKYEGHLCPSCMRGAHTCHWVSTSLPPENVSTMTSLLVETLPPS